MLGDAPSNAPGAGRHRGKRNGPSRISFGDTWCGRSNCDGRILTAKEAAGQLDEYFRGTRRIFDLPLAPQGTPFEEAVWQALLTIPYGETRSYADIARQTGRPSACRPVGRANGHNPISIIIPCHRVIGANKKLTGYTGGLSIKQHLLELEQGATSSFLPLPEEQHMSRDLSSTC